MSEGEKNTEIKPKEYEELSADWRRRDSLTWHMPAVIIAVPGNKVNPCIVKATFFFATAFAVCLTFALWQNLKKQGSNA